MVQQPPLRRERRRSMSHIVDKSTVALAEAIAKYAATVEQAAKKLKHEAEKAAK
jgi:hypothetical protein